MGDVVRAEVLMRVEAEREGLGDAVDGRGHEEADDRRVVGRFSS